MSEQESRNRIDQKLDDIACLLKEISEIGDSHEWIIESGKALLLLEKVDEWRAIREFHRKVKIDPAMPLSELKKRASEADLTSHCQEWVHKKLG